MLGVSKVNKPTFLEEAFFYLLGVPRVEEAITEYWGPRCPDFDPECRVCRTWVRFDVLKKSYEEE